MLVDAETFEPSPRVEEVLAALEGTDAPLARQDGALRLRRRADDAGVRDAGELAEELSGSRAALVRAVEPLGLRVLGRRHASAERGRGTGDRPREALRGVPRGDRPRRAPPGRERRARPRRRAGRRRLHACARVDAALAARGACALGELALPRGCRDRAPLDACGAARAAASRRRFRRAIGSFARWEALVERLRGPGIAPDCDTLLVGRAPAPDVRDDRGARTPTSRPTCAARSRSPRSCRRSSRSRCSSRRARSGRATASSSARTATGRRLRGLDAELAHPDKDAPVPARELAARAPRARRARRRRELGASRLLEPLRDRSRTRRRASSRSGRAKGSPRSAPTSSGARYPERDAPGGDDPGERHPLRALRDAARAGARRSSRPRAARRRTSSGQVHARLGRRADEPRRARRASGAERLLPGLTPGMPSTSRAFMHL